jgi:hypothetical protein
VAEGDVFALEQLNEDLDEAGVELLAGDAAQLLNCLEARHRRPVRVAGGHHVVGVCDRDDPRQLRDVVAFKPARVALPVDPLVVGEDDVRDRTVAVERGDDARTLLRVATDQHPVLVGERHVCLEDAVGEDELADVVQQRRDVDQLLLAPREARFLGDRPRVARHRGRVAGGHLVPQVEGAQHRAQHPHLEAGQLLAAQLQLLGPLLGDQQRAQQVLEGDEDDAEQGDPGEADLDVEVGDPDRHQRRRHLRGKQGDQRRADLGDEGAAFEIAGVGGDHREVDRQRQQEGAEDEQVEGGSPVVIPVSSTTRGRRPRRPAGRSCRSAG